MFKGVVRTVNGGGENCEPQEWPFIFIKIFPQNFSARFFSLRKIPAAHMSACLCVGLGG